MFSQSNLLNFILLAKCCSIASKLVVKIFKQAQQLAVKSKRKDLSLPS